MLQLKGITKNYRAGNTTVAALKGIELEFRENEFVCVLGPSGCGKTTLLNIIGGLDQYTQGDLVINGISTKNYRDNDWDAYRNHSVGFVFQSYNLIPHQTVLSNVELALTLSGVSRAERTARAKKVIEQVGLADQVHKKPNQLSGGQMQRVAIARALVNNPDILLADEPTGALDSETSVQIMELLKEIAKDKLIIMVTHNPELANEYSTRIVRLLDGLVTSDSDPVPQSAEQEISGNSKNKKPSMSFLTALSLSFNNLLTKKTRTFLTAFAGSIGIIGIALILALSNGLQMYISRVEEETLSSYPITIEQETLDIGGLIRSFADMDTSEQKLEPDRVYVRNVMGSVINAATARVTTNDLERFKQKLESDKETLNPLVTDISYSYGIDLRLFKEDGIGGAYQVNPSRVLEELGMSQSNSMGAGFSMPMSSNENMWTELMDNQDFLKTQYDLLAGKWPSGMSEAVLIVDDENKVSDFLLFSLGLKGSSDLNEVKHAIISGSEINVDNGLNYSYADILSLSYALVLPSDCYVESETGWTDASNDFAHMRDIYSSAEKIGIVGILRPNEDAAAASSSDRIGYTSALSKYVIEKTNSSEIVKNQLDNPETDVFTGLPFEAGESQAFKSIEDIYAYIGTLPDEMKKQTEETLQAMLQGGAPEEQVIAIFNDSLSQRSSSATYDGNLKLLGYADLGKPSAINIYASSFENKEAISDYIKRYNESAGDAHKITYTDYVGLLMSSVTTVINAISYVLIAFVSISLVVSSIMIGIITYISVLERTKEIGILRSIGAAKRDVSRVFNAETLIIGFVAGALGIAVTLVLCVPANSIIYELTEIKNVAVLPPVGAIILVLISMALSFVAGLIPSRVAAHKDPVVALRTE